MTLKRSLKSTVKLKLALYSVQTVIWAAVAGASAYSAANQHYHGTVGTVWLWVTAGVFALLAVYNAPRIVACVKVLHTLRKHPELVYLAEIQHQFGNNYNA